MKLAIATLLCGSAAAFSPAALKGKTVSVRTGSRHEEFLKRYLPEATIAGFPSEVEALAAVQNNQAQAFFGDAMRASFWLNDNLSCCGFAGDKGLYIHPGIWHEGVFTASGRQRFFDKQGAVHARVSVDFAREFNCLLEAPL